MRAIIARVVSLGIGVAGASLFPCQHSLAQDLAKRAIPNKWLQPMVPEDLAALKLPEYVSNDPLDKARAEVFAGRYKLSLLTLHSVKNGDPVEVALVRASALSPLGRREEAIQTLSEANIRNDPRVQVACARVLAESGRPGEAIALLQTHLQQHPDSIAGHYWLGNISESIGDLVTARQAFGWFEPFIDKWQGRSATAFRSAEDVTLMGRGLDRWAGLTTAYRTRPALHNIILSMFLKAYDEIDRGYWPAHLAAAEYYISHDDPQSAMKELQQVLAKNPNDIPTRVVLSRILISMFNFDATDQMIDLIRNVDPAAIEADLLETRTLLTQRRPTDAQQPVRRVLAKQPKNLEAMGLLAATEALQLHDEKTAEILKQVEKIDPQNATAYLEVAEALSAMRQYPRSAAMYNVAIERAPWWTTVRNGLGLLYTQSGDEEEAARVLEAARALDPFNHETTNYLRLLDSLSKFARKETEHFVVMYDAKKDPLIPEYFGDYLESIYKDVCGIYKQEPPVKTYIEVFPTQEEFAVRAVGSPWIGATGASTGRVIALVTPRQGQGATGAFNWALVLRHEFTHTVTLAATDNRIAHWMTEGLATVEERSPLRWQWVPMLYQAVKQKQLFTMENLTFAFWRPKRPIDRQLAYAESYWICKYIEDTWGHDKILLMLAEFRQGKEQREVFPQILGKDLTEFQTDFFAWTEKQVAGWGYDPETSKKYDELVKRGELLIKERKYEAAVKVWTEIAALRPVDKLPHTRLAGLYMTKEANDPDKAIEQLLALHKVEVQDNRYAKKIARLYRDNDDLENAQKYGLQAVYIDPYNLDAHELLAEIYEKAGNGAGLAREERVIPVLTAWLKNESKAVTVPRGN